MTGFPGLLNCFLHDTHWKPLELKVQLKPGNPFLGTRDFAIHVTERIFPTHDVSEDAVSGNFTVLIEIGTDANTDTRTSPLHFNTGIHERQTAAANRSHGTRSIGFQDFRNLTDSIRIIPFCIIYRQHRQKGTLSQCTMPYLTSTWPHDTASLTHRIIRKVVVHHVLFTVCSSSVTVEALSRVSRAQGGGHKCLRLASGKQC